MFCWITASLQIIFLDQGAVYHTWHLSREFQAVPADGSVFAGRSQPSPTHSHQPVLHPRQKLITQHLIQGTTQRGAVPEGQGTGTVQAGGNQGNFWASQVMKKSILKFSCKNRRGKKIADRSMEPRHCRFEVCEEKKKKSLYCVFLFSPLKCHDLFSPKYSPTVFCFQKKTKISTDNSVGSSSLSCRQNRLHI